MTVTSAQLRRQYLDYFKGKGHTEVASSPLVPQNDPTMMFTNSGMVQFKDIFTGKETRGYKRATTSQKCVRAGGKHNDLDNVGYTGRHLTFFEMLGNFSFGDYFKEDVIPFAWEFVTKELQMPKDRLYVTVYQEDDEAYDLWTKKMGVAADHMIRIGDNKGARYMSDNFWMMGETGPCGPCSELFIDQGAHMFGGPPGSADEDGDRFLEFWNLVFMQYERDAAGNMTKLPRPSIDTGMGMERMLSILNGKENVWGTDILRSIIEASAHATNTDPDGPQSRSHRVIADHLRSSAFLVAEGVLPSNEGRGYVLRRIMRRAMRYAHMLGAKDPLMYRLVPTLLEKMGGHYQELERASALITETLKDEELRFRTTLERGLKLLDSEIDQMGESKTLSGSVAFKLYDTYGFPLDLTQDALRAKDLEVDTAGFDAAMQAQKAEARKSWAGSGDSAVSKIWFDLKDKFGATDFLGYTKTVGQGEVLAIIKDSQVLDVASAETGEVMVFINQTPFYGESGGQVGDSGTLESAKGAKAVVRDTQKQLGLHAHFVTLTAGSLKVGDAVALAVDTVRRAAIKANHSATHLLHAALRNRLGSHVTQKGSLVSAERLRFDISHNKALTADDIAAVEAEVNARIRENSRVETRVMTPDQAIDAGAMALFGEKYGDEVRVLSMGAVDASGKPFSLELCGGTHVSQTGEIGLLKLTSDSAVSAGVRRIEAVTGQGALALFNDLQHEMARVSGALGAASHDAAARVQTVLDERRALEKEVADLRRKLALSGGAGAQAAPAVQDVGGVKYDARTVDLPAKDLKPMVDELKKQIGSGVVALVSTADGKASIVVGVTADLAARFSAVDLVKVGSAACGGAGGGGRPDLAQAGGPDAASAPKALEAIAAALTAA